MPYLQKRVSIYPAFLSQVYHFEPNNANLTDRNPINQHIYNRLIVRFLSFTSYKKLVASEKSGGCYHPYSDEVAVLGNSKDKLEDFLGKIWSNSLVGADVYCIRDCAFVGQRLHRVSITWAPLEIGVESLTVRCEK